ncbi:MAG: PD-(D/E)XK nuclease family protein [Nanoarchaeota archaeon]
MRIMTNHATKGLEYSIVIVSGMVRGKFPVERLSKDQLLPSELLPEIKDKITDIPSYLKEEAIAELERDNQLSEERRLCYVAFTRAKEKLILTYARDYNNKPHVPSQFLSEINCKTNLNIVFEKDDALTIESEPVIATETNTQSRAPPKPKRITFSPSALLLFTECQKKYEYKYRYQMPEKQPISWEDLRLGSFVHEIIEDGIKHQFRTEGDFLDLARTCYVKEEWRIINLDEALTILRVFFQRNKHKYDQHSLTEQKLRVNIDGLEFEGYADRIDIHTQGLEIIDYKTGRAFITAQHRNWQLGLYALAAPNLNIGPVKRLTLDMLRHEKPLEFDLGEDNIAREINSPKTFFNLDTVKQELIVTAQKILECYEKEFAPCDIEKNCGFCNEFVWKI